MRRAALYVRVSTDLQEREQTIQSQLAAVTRHAEQHGLHHLPALTYTDDGYSGTWLDRPGLDELRDHAREGRFDVVVVLSPDRLARRYAYQVLLLEELKRAGIEVLFCERPINDSPDDQLLLQIQGAIAEYERAKILERCRRGRLHRARRGELAPPSPPYGYIYAAKKYGGDGQIRVHDEEAAMVRQLFEWYAEEGTSLYRMSQMLTASSWKPRRGQGWSSPLILQMLRREWYIGRAYYNRRSFRLQDRSRGESTDNRRSQPIIVERPRSEWIIVPVPRIVDEALFARVQKRIEENRRFAKRRLKRERVYLLRGLVRCGLCGHTYTGKTRMKVPKTNAGLREHRYYECRMRTDALASSRCNAKGLLAAGADEVVWTTIRDLLLDNESLVEQLKTWLARTTADPAGDERLGLTTSRLTEMNRQKSRLIDAYQMGALELAEFQSRKTTIEERILTVEQELADLQSWASKRELAMRQMASAEIIVEQLRAQLADPDFETKQSILRLVIEKVVVTNYRLEIHLALPVSGSSHLTYTWGANDSPARVRVSTEHPRDVRSG
ncbi:MAG: recombinase family protein [Candidatus Methylomirabilis sp.]